MKWDVTGFETQAHEEKIKAYCSEEMAGSGKRREEFQHDSSFTKLTQLRSIQEAVWKKKGSRKRISYPPS